jgi:hypothetical protein
MFSETIKLAARGHRPSCAVLGEFMFASGTMYLHNNAGILQSKDVNGAIEAIEWKGLQGLARVSGLGASKIGNARQVTCSLDITDVEIREKFADQQTDVRGRLFRFWCQFYDEDRQPLDARFHIYTGTGDRLRMKKIGPSSRSIELLLEDFFVRRRRSANSMVTHSDQQIRDPGSTGFIYVNQMVDQTLNLFDASN